MKNQIAAILQKLFSGKEFQVYEKTYSIKNGKLHRHNMHKNENKFITSYPDYMQFLEDCERFNTKTNEFELFHNINEIRM